MKLDHVMPFGLAVAAAFWAALVLAADPPETLVLSKPAQASPIDDATITSRVKAALMKEPQLKSLDVNVQTRRGEVLLSGFVHDQMQKQIAMRSAIAVSGVASVKDAMEIR